MTIDSKGIYKILKRVVSTTNATSEVLPGKRKAKIKMAPYSEINECAILLLHPTFTSSLIMTPEIIVRRKISSLLNALEKKAFKEIGNELKKIKKIPLRFSGLKLIISDKSSDRTFAIGSDHDFFQVPQKNSAGIRYYCAFIGICSVIQSRTSTLQLCDLLSEFYEQLSNETSVKNSPAQIKFPKDGEALQRQLRRMKGSKELKPLWIQLRRLQFDKEIRRAHYLLARSSDQKNTKKT